MVEEAMRISIPSLVIDVKGDLPNLLLAFLSFDSVLVMPWAAATMAPNDTRTVEEVARALCEEREASLGRWGIDEAALRTFHETTHVRVITPGSTAGESLHLLSSLERRSPRWDNDVESARTTLSAAISLVLRLLGRDPDPSKSREHLLLSVLAERRLLVGETADLGALLHEVLEPPIEQIGALELDEFVSKSDQRSTGVPMERPTRGQRSRCRQALRRAAWGWRSHHRTCDGHLYVDGAPAESDGYVSLLLPALRRSVIHSQHSPPAMVNR